MVDISVTAASVVPSVNAQKVDGTAGATLTAGLMAYKDTTTGTWKVADCTSATAHVDPHMVAVGASSGQPVILIKKDPALTLNAVLTAGLMYVLSTAGGIAPAADLAANDYGVFLGVANTTTSLDFNPTVGGIIV